MAAWVELITKLYWPATVGILVFMFRTQIANAFRHGFKVGKDGIEVSATQSKEAAAVENADESIELQDPREIPALIPFTRIQAQEVAVHQIQDEDIYYRYTAAHQSRRAASYYILIHIFGTQWRALREIISHPRNERELQPLFLEHQNHDGGYNSQSEWLSFLLREGMIYFEDMRYHPTEMGVSVYEFLTNEGRSADLKPF